MQKQPKETMAQLRRDKKAMMLAIDAFMNDSVKEFTKIVGNKEMLEDVLDQFANGERTSGEMKSWIFKYNQGKYMTDKTPEELMEYLEVPHLEEQLRDLNNEIFIKFRAFYNKRFGELR